jgi:hypothetical protein
MLTMESSGSCVAGISGKDTDDRKSGWDRNPCLEDEGLEVVDQRSNRVCDSGDDVAENLAKLELLDDAIAIGVEDSKECDNGIVEALVHRQVVFIWCGELEEDGEDRRDFIIRDVSASVGICR